MTPLTWSVWPLIFSRGASIKKEPLPLRSERGTPLLGGATGGPLGAAEGPEARGAPEATEEGAPEEGAPEGAGEFGEQATSAIRKRSRGRESMGRRG
jgi:hypothetical protein